MNDRQKATILILVSALCFSLVALQVKLLVDMSAMQKVVIRGIVGCTFLLLFRRKSIKRPTQVKLLTLRSVLGFIGMVLYFYAISGMVLSDAVILNKLSPFFVLIFSVIFLREKLYKHQIFSLILAIVGAALIIRPDFSSSFSYSMIALLSAAFAGAAYVCITAIAQRDNATTMVFFFSLFSVVVGLPIAIVQGITWPSRALDWLLFLGIGIVALFAQLSMTRAYSLTKASDVSIYSYANVVFSMVFSFVFFAQIPDVWSIIGFFSILIASLINYHFRNQRV